MSLTTQDLDQIRTIVVGSINEAFEVLANPRFDKIERELQSLNTRVTALEEGQREINHRLSRLEQQMEDMSGQLEALENDVKELYKSITSHEHTYIGSKKYLKLPEDKKILALYDAIQVMAKTSHVSLPR